MGTLPEFFMYKAKAYQIAENIAEVTTEVEDYIDRVTPVIFKVRFKRVPSLRELDALLDIEMELDPAIIEATGPDGERYETPVVYHDIDGVYLDE